MLISQNDPRARRGQLVLFVVWVAVTAIGLLLAADPHGHGTHQELGLPPCPSVLFFGRPCPGCGLTTSWTALLHGNLSFAFHAHPLGPVLYAIFTATAFFSVWLYAKNLRIDPRDPRPEKAAMVAVGIFFAFGLYRMATTTNYRTERENAMVGLLKIR